MLEDAQTTAFVGATDLDRAHDFYGHMLGLEVVERTDFATVYDGGGTPIRVTQVDEPVAADYTVLGWVVSDIGGAMAALVARGVRFERYEGLVQDEDGVWTAPSGGLTRGSETPTATPSPSRSPPPASS